MPGEAEPRGHPMWILALSVAAFSTAAILTKLATAGPFAITLWRLSLPALAALPFVVRQGGLSRLRASTWGLLVLSGVLLCLHFAAWITSLRLTSVASSVTVVTTYPLFLFAWEIAHGRRIPRVARAGVGVSLIGAAVLAAGDAGGGIGSLGGDGLALVASAAGAGYLLIGRSLRQEMRVLPYTTAVYLVAGLFSLLLALATRERVLDVGLANWAIFILLAIGPTTLGHTLSNYVLRWVDASTVGMFSLLEAVGAGILAIFVFGQVPPILTVVGGLLMLSGLALYVRMSA